MTVTKDQVDRYIRKLYKFLDEGNHKINFKKMRNYVGELNTGPWLELDEGVAIITIDHRCELLSILIHETLHRFHPTQPEEWILAMESKIINKITNRQVKNIIKRLAKNI